MERRIYALHSPYFAVLGDRLGNFNNTAEYSRFSSKIERLMYRTFAFQSGESARQQRLTSVLLYVLLWSNRRADHLSKNDSRNDPPQVWVVARTRGFYHMLRTLCS